MASLSLPPPRKTPLPSAPQNTGAAASQNQLTLTTTPQSTTSPALPSKNNATTHIPSYEERCRAATEASQLTAEERRRTGRTLFVPRSLQDFGDGGAFPEIHVAQYPRHMGNPHLLRKQAATTAITTTGNGKSGSGNRSAPSTSSAALIASRAIVNVQVDKDGEISYDAIVKGGTNTGRIVYSRHEDLRGGPAKPEDIRLPTPEEEEAEAARTQAALQALVAGKDPNVIDKGNNTGETETQFIKYTPRPDAPGYNPAAAQRVIQMVPAKVDPLMPPKHKHLKAPRGPAEDPVPVLHAPPTNKLTKEERDQWNVPACISNWKNMRGYTIPLDKRLAADGRGLREHTINPNFATLSESLYVAERQARQEVRMRAAVQKKLALQQKEQREEELRQLAQQARLERGGASAAAAESITRPPHDDDHSGSDSDSRHRDHDDEEEDDDSGSDRRHRNERQDEQEQKPDSEDVVAARQRERLRQERRRERERELRMEKNVKLKKQKLEEERDVSEKIALGVHTGTGGGGDVDARLYSQTGGLDSGFGAEDEYNAYSKPLFDRQGVTSSSIYRPSRGEAAMDADDQYDKLVDGATRKFKPDKGFAGAEGGMDAGPRSGPVQFEKGKHS